MKVTLVSTHSGRRLHIRHALFTALTLCGAYATRLVWSNYELSGAEPNIAGLHGLCKTCLSALRTAQGEGDV